MICFSQNILTKKLLLRWRIFQLACRPSIKYVCNRGEEKSSKMRTAVYMGREHHASCLRGRLNYFIYLAAFLSYLVFYICRNLTLTLIQIRCVCQKRSFFSNEISVCCLEISFFNFKITFANKSWLKRIWFFSNRILCVLYILGWYLTLRRSCAA